MSIVRPCPQSLACALLLGISLDFRPRPGTNRSGSSNLLPRASRAGHDRLIGCIEDFTDRFCPDPSVLRWALLADAKTAIRRWPDRPLASINTQFLPSFQDVSPQATSRE